MAWTAAAAGLGLVGNLAGASAAKKAAKVADQRLVEGRNYAINESGLGDYRDAGVAAQNTQADLLGIGGDPAASQQAFNQYLGSTGYRTALDAGSQAITGNAAAKGMLNSGATLKALQQNGAGIGQQFTNNYLNQVGDVANRGYGAASNLAQTVTGVSANQANVAQQVGQDVGNAYASTGSLLGKAAGYVGGGKGALGIFS